MSAIRHCAGMVKVSEIEDRGSLEAWLLDRPEEETKKFAITIAHRSTMRVLPVYWLWAVQNSHLFGSQNFALPELRCAIITSVARKTPTHVLKKAAVSAVKFLEKNAADVVGEITIEDISRCLARAAYVVNDDSGFSTIAAKAVELTSFADHKWKHIKNDCAELQIGDLLLATPLWHSDENPFQKDWDDVRQSLTNSQGYGLNYGQDYGGTQTEDWSFWINWYQDALEGREPDWDLLEEIALIPDEDWEKGPEHINNQVIAGIVEKYRLLRDVQALRKDLAAVRQTAIAAPMGHNNPPEGIEAEAEVVTQTEIIWAALEEAEEELSKPEPSPSVLKRAGTAILKALGEIGKYGAKLGDVGLKATAATVGGGLGAYLISKGPEIQSIAERISEYVWP